MGTWQLVGGIEDGGDIGGDVQASDAYSVRYHHTTNPKAMVTIGFYAAALDVSAAAAAGPYTVQRQVEYMVCRDRRNPGGTEEWCDYTYDDLGRRDLTLDAATAKAREYAEQYAADTTGERIMWDGTSRIW